MRASWTAGIGCLTALAGAAAAEPPGEGYRPLGRIQPRHAGDIAASKWSVGAETMDRDYTVYANWRRHLGPLGVKKARIQSGWAKTEKAHGQYDWAWLDEIIPDMVAQGVRPWVCLCYGNPIYPGGGGTGLGGGLPSSDEALGAWDAYVAAFVDRYGKHVDEWEIWNEPRGGVKAAPEYAALVVRTAEIVRRLQPKAAILFAAGGAFDVPYAKEVLECLRGRGKLHLVNAVIYHPYSPDPDGVYDKVKQLREVAASYSDRIGIRQGENGCPSQRGSFGALSEYDWTEKSQAKWALRRLLGDLGRDIPSSYFSICDMAYSVGATGRDTDLRTDPAQKRVRINYKGLLAINEDKTVHHPKVAYRAVQHLTAVFDDRLSRIVGLKADVKTEPHVPVSVFGYAKADGATVLTIWTHKGRPTDEDPFQAAQVTVAGGRFADPVHVDLLSGQAWDIPDGKWAREADGYVFRDVRVYDSPVLIADSAALPPLTKD